MEKTSLEKLQQQMIDYLLCDDEAICNKIVSQGAIDNHTRLDIYKNAYRMRLKETLDTDHDILGLYLGDELFEQMVNGYIDLYPSRYTSLRQYADNLPEFLATQPPFADFPLLSELARFERLLLTAFDAADVTRFTLEDIQDIAHEQWPGLVFHFHPSVQLAHMHWNSVESWQALKTGQAPDPAREHKSCWLLWRNRDRLTEFRSISEEEASLFHMILAGENFSALCEFLLQNHDGSENDNVTTVALNYLSGWIEQGLLRKV
ncbi:putative DNA-binding domain-containing protein [Thalassomonas viridans]|uniref:DNA-binding domain-containing protein n=1 Tax=Thalassomonas viridans TaxID=137584 RepID=A0AAE9Z0F6_9GAMM|nr:DNA-binding domain-containing protein [Thalassomonas viridans]WDE03815.1 putative DNA-binding domain-containing protein [Thalassomonas viridans]